MRPSNAGLLSGLASSDTSGLLSANGFSIWVKPVVVPFGLIGPKLNVGFGSSDRFWSITLAASFGSVGFGMAVILVLLNSIVGLVVTVAEIGF